MKDLCITLKVREAVEQELDGLIRAAARNVKQLQELGMTDSQIRNVVNVAAGTESMEAVTNFIRYQIGRDKGKKPWSTKPDGAQQSFGKAVIVDIETGTISAAFKRVMAKVPEAMDEGAAVRAQLTRLYLGYLTRCFVYADKSNDWSSLCSRLEQQGGGS